MCEGSWDQTSQIEGDFPSALGWRGRRLKKESESVYEFRMEEKQRLLEGIDRGWRWGRKEGRERRKEMGEEGGREEPNASSNR